MKQSIRRHRASKRGFSAIELAAVASIIAILALILIPIVRTRLETARQTAAVDDMRTIEVAQTLANADTGQTYRLCDLDNPKPDLDLYNLATATPAQRETAVRSVPNGTWNKPFSAAEQADGTKLGIIGALWNGPYTTFNKTKFLTTAALLANPQFRVVNIDGVPATTSSGTGPMPIFESASGGGPAINDGTPPYNDDGDNNELWPIDPWGSHYIYFGTGRMGIAAGDTANTTAGIVETNWGVSAVYSTGPDGFPGNFAGPFTGTEWFREAGLLGTQDDYYRFF